MCRSYKKKRVTARKDAVLITPPRRVEIIDQMSDFFQTELVKDRRGNEYVLLKSLDWHFGESSNEPDDKTAFEAGQNHIHILDNLSRVELKYLRTTAQNLCDGILSMLCGLYPNKQFFVYASASLHDSFIVRFHQAWPGEPAYFEGFPSTKKEWVCCSHNFELS